MAFAVAIYGLNNLAQVEAGEVRFLAMEVTP